MSVQKYYLNGNEKFATVAPIVTEAFHIDFGAQTTANGARTLVNFPKGTVIVGWAGRIVEAAESLGSGTMAFGFTGTIMVSSALGSGAMTLGAMIRPSSTHEDNGPLVLTADDTFDATNATTGMSAGKVDVYVTYIPLPKDNLDTNVFKVFTTT